MNEIVTVRRAIMKSGSVKMVWHLSIGFRVINNQHSHGNYCLYIRYQYGCIALLSCIDMNRKKEREREERREREGGGVIDREKERDRVRVRVRKRERERVKKRVGEVAKEWKKERKREKSK